MARIASELHASEHNTKRSENLEAKARAVTPHEVQRPVTVDHMQVQFKFSEDKETGIQVVQVLDADSGKIVRQIPPDEMLNVAKALRQITGLLVSKVS